MSIFLSPLIFSNAVAISFSNCQSDVLLQKKRKIYNFDNVDCQFLNLCDDNPNFTLFNIPYFDKSVYIYLSINNDER